MPDMTNEGDPCGNMVHIDVYTRDVFAQMGTEGVYDPVLQDATSLIQYGAWGLRNLSGMGYMAREEICLASMTSGVDPEHPQPMVRRWESISQDREPFMMVAWDIHTGVVGVVEGRVYTYAPTGDKAIFIYWVVVRDTGDGDQILSYQGRGVGRQLYEQVEAFARARGVDVIIAGVHTENTNSQHFHASRGFHNETCSGGDTCPHATPCGVYIPPYPIADIDEQGEFRTGQLAFWSKRLR